MSAMDAKPAPKIGKYEVLDTLGRGGMGVVYRAIDPRIGRLVAIKMITGDYAKDPDYLNRFYREARSTGTLQHVNIVTVYDLGDQDGVPYLVMEYLEGEPLDKIIASRRDLSLPDRLDIIIQACNGLQYAHQHGVVHRDIKPGNIMVLKDGNVKLVDFGIARLGNSSMTATGQMIGTISYMSPEQINGQAVDSRSDIFSAGVVLFELLTYTLPFDGKEITTTMRKILNDPPPPLKNFFVGPPELDAALNKALAKNRDQRYQTANDFGFDLATVQQSLKRLKVSEYMQSAKAYIEQANLARAQELLSKVVKTDTQNTEARALMSRVQSELQRQQRIEHLGQLRADAEEALNSGRFDEALTMCNEAIGLAPDATWEELRARAQQGADRKTKIDSALKRAHAAFTSGAFESAEEGLKEALAIDPGNAQLNALLNRVQQAMADRDRERRIADSLETARKQIAARRFTAALEALKTAEAVDPNHLELKSLKKLAIAGQQQEVQRKELETLSADIHTAMDWGDFENAWNKINDALAKFPSEASLLKLRAEVVRRRDAASAGARGQEQIAAARELLDQGRGAEAIAILESAVRAAPSDARLSTALKNLRDEVHRHEQQQLRAECLKKARAALDAHDYAAAVQVLKETCSALPGSADLEDLLKFAREELGRKSGVSVTSAATALDLETTAGVKVESARSASVPVAPPEARVAVPPPPPVAPQGASHGASAQASVAPAQVPPATGPTAPATSAVAAAAPVQPVPEAPRKRSDIPMLLGVVVVVVALLAGGYFAHKHFTASKSVAVSAPAAPALPPSPAPATGPMGSLEIYAVPWGTVKTVSSVDGKTRIDVNQATPMNMMIAPGNYLVVIASPEGQEQWGNVTVSEANSARYQVVFRQIDVQEIIRGH